MITVQFIHVQSERKVKMKKIIGLALASLVVLLLSACSPVGITGSAESESTIAAAVEPIGDDSHNPLDMLEFTLPDEISACRDSNSQETFWRNEEQVGGIFLLEHGNEVFDNILNYQETVSPLILDAMEKMGKPRFEWYVSNSSFYGIMETNMGIEKEEYIAYVVRGYSACYVVWFDRNQVSTDEEISIMQSLSSDDITEELNTISSQAYADAVAESMAKNEYQFEITLPSNIKSEEQTEEGALFYENGQLVGGYKVIHFEKGILPEAQKNQDIILSRLKEYLADQVDLTEFSGEVFDDGLITVEFRNNDIVYTHHLLSYGQVGTQYDIWVDKNKLNKDTINSIVAGAELVKIGS